MRGRRIRVKTMTEIMFDKTVLRQSLLAARNAIPAQLRSDWDAAIRTRVIAWWQADPVQTLGVYWPIRSEPDLREAYAELAQRGVQLALPVVTGRTAPLAFFAWTPGDRLAQDAFGIAIPASTTTALQPQALLIPCVGFNPLRIRIGYGGGYYDRTLAAALRPLAIGIGYDCTLAAFDGAPHDVPMDRIITETSCMTGD